jgi:hypothetical protein
MGLDSVLGVFLSVTAIEKSQELSQVLKSDFIEALLRNVPKLNKDSSNIVEFSPPRGDSAVREEFFEYRFFGA